MRDHFQASIAPGPHEQQPNERRMHMNEYTMTPEMETEQRELAAILEEHPDAAHDVMVFAQGVVTGKKSRARQEKEE